MPTLIITRCDGVLTCAVKEYTASSASSSKANCKTRLAASGAWPFPQLAARMRQAISVSGAWGMPLSPACVCKPDIPINSPLAFNSTPPTPFLLSANATYQPVHGSPARATHWGSSASPSGLHSAGHTQDNPHPSTAVGVIVPFLTSRGGADGLSGRHVGNGLIHQTHSGQCS